MIGYYLTHPQVLIDPAIPVPDWQLSPQGRARLEAVAGRRWLADVRRVVSSRERKAVETAEILAQARGLEVEKRSDMGENDRSSTGYMPADRFERAADRFFAEPDVSWNGWEMASDASRRVVKAVGLALENHPVDMPVLFVGHGAVGTLLKCHLSGRPISRAEDQPAGGGNIFAFMLKDRTLLADWTSIETFQGFADGQ